MDTEKIKINTDESETDGTREIKAWIFDEIMENLNSNIYISDIETHRILFMNRKMKETFNHREPEGKLCWLVCQKNMDAECPFCPVPKLLQDRENKTHYVWKEVSSFDGRTYENYDSLIRWVDGKLVHFQQSLDITDSEILNIDELCKLPTRRKGKEMLASALSKIETTGGKLAVVLLDINNLKETNDSFGHAAGDFVLSHTTAVIKKYVTGSDFVFRLGGDEFVAVIFDKSEAEVHGVLDKCRRETEKLNTLFDKPYGFTFCYGVCMVNAKDKLGEKEILERADEAMFRYKLELRKSSVRLKKIGAESEIVNTKAFNYDTTQLYDALVRCADDYIYICNMKTGMFRYPPELVKLLDLPAEVIKHPLPFWKDIVHPDDWNDFYRSNMDITNNVTDEHVVEFRAMTVSGEYEWLKCFGHLMHDKYGEPSIFAGIITRVGKSNRIDAFSGMFNEYEMSMAFSRLISEKSAAKSVAVVTLGIDDFWKVNQLYDRDFGDIVIKSAARDAQAALPHNVRMFRLDGDKVGLLMTNSGQNDVSEMYDRIRTLFAEHQLLKRYNFSLTVSGGCAFWPNDGSTFQELHKYAECALKRSKTTGKNKLTFFYDELLKEESRILEMQRCLVASVGNGFENFSVVYQPQVDSHTAKIIGAEALARWKCDSLGEVGPAEFIPVLEKENLISKVGQFVLVQALQAALPWVQRDDKFIISVNVSYLQLMDGNFVSDVKRVVTEAGFPPCNLMLELTENYMISGAGNANVFAELKQFGIKVAIDDFGTGYSSLGMLKCVDIDRVKIDRVFAKDVVKNKSDVIFIKCIAEICRDANIEVCLEGVENNEEYDKIKDLSIDCIQGFLFGRPCQREKIEEYFEKKPNGTK